MTAPFGRGTRIAGTGRALPEGTLTNADLEKIVDTSDEWIVQRTGIRMRHRAAETDTVFSLGRDALLKALERAGVRADELDMIIVATVSGEMLCPSTAARISEAVGAGEAAVFDLAAACSGFLYGLNLADTMIRCGRAEKVAIIGVEVLTRLVDWNDRTVSIIFGDGAGAAVVVADPDPRKGCVHQTMHGDGRLWRTLYHPRCDRDVPPGDEANPIRLGHLRMHGREIYKFAVTRFQEAIQDALDRTGLKVDDVQQYVCHQSNQRIIESAVEKLKLPPDRVYVNIDRYGNTSAASIPICLDELYEAGRIEPGKPVILVAFGAGVTWASCVWNP
jgi:3-oxoacyl-[acyl-carrier-protein] synthase-3